MSMASEDCASSQPLETKAVVVAEVEFLGDVGVQGEVASSNADTPAESAGIGEDESVQEKYGESDPMETPAQGVQTEASKKETVQKVENEAADDGVEEEDDEALGAEAIEHSPDTAADTKTIQAKVSDKEELVKPLEYLEEDIEIPKAETVEDPSLENVPMDATTKKSEKELTEQESEYDHDQEKENERPIGTEIEENAVVEDVGRENIASDTPLAAGESGLKERPRAEPEQEERFIVEDAANEVVETKEPERVADQTDGKSNDDLTKYKIPSPEPTNASVVVAMDRTAVAAEDGPVRTVGAKQKEKPETMQAPEFEAKASLEKECIEGKATENWDAQVLPERIVREMDKGKVESTLNARNEVIEAEQCDSTNRPSATTLVMNLEGNARKEQGDGKQSRKLMSRVKSSLGKVRKAIIGRPSTSSKTIVVDARLEEKVQ